MGKMEDKPGVGSWSGRGELELMGTPLRGGVG